MDRFVKTVFSTVSKFFGNSIEFYIYLFDMPRRALCDQLYESLRIKQYIKLEKI